MARKGINLSKNEGFTASEKGTPKSESNGLGGSVDLIESEDYKLKAVIDVDISPLAADISYDVSSNELGVSGEIGLPGGVIGVGGGVNIDLNTGEVIGGSASLGFGGADIEVSFAECERTLQITYWGVGFAVSEDTCKEDDEDEDEEEKEDNRDNDEISKQLRPAPKPRLGIPQGYTGWICPMYEKKAYFDYDWEFQGTGNYSNGGVYNIYKVDYKHKIWFEKIGDYPGLWYQEILSYSEYLKFLTTTTNGGVPKGGDSYGGAAGLEGTWKATGLTYKFTQTKPGTLILGLPLRSDAYPHHFGNTGIYNTAHELINNFSTNYGCTGFESCYYVNNYHPSLRDKQRRPIPPELMSNECCDASVSMLRKISQVLDVDAILDEKYNIEEFSKFYDVIVKWNKAEIAKKQKNSSYQIKPFPFKLKNYRHIMFMELINNYQLDNINKALGVDLLLEKGQTIPLDLLMPEVGEAEIKMNTYLEMFNVLWRVLDHRTSGQIEVTLKDTNKVKEGDQPITMTMLNNQSILKEIYQTILETKYKQGDQLQILVRLAFLSSQIARMTHGTQNMVDNIVKFLTIPTKPITDYITIPFNLLLGKKDAGKGFKPTEQPTEEEIMKMLDVDTPEAVEEILPRLANQWSMPIIVQKFSKGGDFWFFSRRSK